MNPEPIDPAVEIAALLSGDDAPRVHIAGGNSAFMVAVLTYADAATLEARLALDVAAISTDYPEVNAQPPWIERAGDVASLLVPLHPSPDADDETDE